MGKALIVSGGTDGSYTIQVDYGSDRIAARIGQVDSYITVKQELIDHITTVIDSNKDIYDARSTLLDIAIQLYKNVLADPASTDKQKNNAYDVLRQASHDMLIAKENYQGNQTVRERYKLELASLQARKYKLQSLTPTKNMQAWCADLSEELTGIVATLDVPGEPQDILVAPKGGPWSPAYGNLIMREALSPAQAYWNAAVLPGWQKWMPTWRFATISNIDTALNTCTVNLHAAKSSAQNLDINQGTTLTDVPVVYMTCNALAFEDGDEVVVQFNGQTVDNPVVVGFKDNPKACGWSAYYGSWNGAVHYLDLQVGVERFFDGTIDQFEAYVRVGGGSWTLLQNTVDSADNRKWVDTSESPTNLRPEIEMLKGGSYYNAYLFLRPLVLRAGSNPINYTVTGVNEFRLMKGTKKLFHYAYEVSNSWNSFQNANIVARPFLVGGTIIKEPLVDEQPLLPHVDDYITGWSPTA